MTAPDERLGGEALASEILQAFRLSFGELRLPAAAPSLTIREDGGVMIHRAYTGRDPAGHAEQANLRNHYQPGMSASEVRAQMSRQLAQQLRRAERSGWTPPVTPGPDMTLAHLRVHSALARRLRIDHGPDAQDRLRDALLAMLQARTRKRRGPGRALIPYGLAIDANRIDHREPLGEGVAWKGRQLTIDRLLPQTLLAALGGQPVSRLVEHPILDGLVIEDAWSDRSAHRRAGGVTVARVADCWIPGDAV